MYNLAKPYILKDGNIFKVFYPEFWGVKISNSNFAFKDKYFLLSVNLVDKQNENNGLTLFSLPVTESGSPDPDNIESSIDTFDEVWSNYIDLSQGGPEFNNLGLQWLIAKIPNLYIQYP